MSRLVSLVLLLAGLAAVVLTAGSGSSTAVQAPAPDTIVSVTGDAANGFEVRHHDGSALFLPTDSEARAECAEYSTRVARVRCRTEVRTWYRDLADLQQALDWAHTQRR